MPRILELLVQVNMVHHNGRPDLFKGPATKYTEEELETIIADPERPVFVFTDEKDITLGYAFCIVKETKNDNLMMDHRTLYIDDLCVDEECRGQHIGKQLLEYVESYAKKNSFDSLTLNVWKLNDSAYEFYLKNGMEIQKIGMEKILR
ncbi:MAG: GNAT family N-acetyltransferase [Clostridia bacterium]|nr:GNAT family N-acetyltransferase [Clostridia bacterium]